MTALGGFGSGRSAFRNGRRHGGGRGGIGLQKYIFIALGGALGSIARYWVGSSIASRVGAKFPYGTFVINLTACVIIGFSLTYLGKRTELNPAWRFLVPIGFVGAYSTFRPMSGKFSPLCETEPFSCHLSMHSEASSLGSPLCGSAF